MKAMDMDKYMLECLRDWVNPEELAWLIRYAFALLELRIAQSNRDPDETLEQELDRMDNSDHGDALLQFREELVTKIFKRLQPKRKPKRNRHRIRPRQ
jgi:hypothetical protein